MKKHLIPAFLVATALGNPAQADEASFVQGFANVCTQFVMFGLGGTMEAFAGYGWHLTAGADLGDYEAYKNGTTAFVATSATGRQPGCTIMDENVSIATARDLLIRTLDISYPNAVKGTGSGGGEVWRALRENGTLIFSIQEDLSGSGSSISFELRP